MRHTFPILITLITVSGLGLHLDASAADEPAPIEAPALPALPEPVAELVIARPFALDESFEHTWRKECPEFNAGYILVLRVNPASVFSRQSSEPVLFVGDQTAEKVNVGFDSGRLVAIVPSELDEHGQVRLDLTKSMVWFGQAQLPELVDAGEIRLQADLARRAGILPFSQDAVARALQKGGKAVHLKDKDALIRSMAPLVREFAPSETDLAASMARQGQ